MKFLSESYQTGHPNSVIREKQDRMERCSNLFPGIGAQYQKYRDELHTEAMSQIISIESTIAERYHYETRKIIPDCFKQALRHKATLTYLQIVDDLKEHLIMTSGVEDEDT